MERLARSFRVFSGILVLLNLIVFFLPVSRFMQQNYPTRNMYQADFIRAVFEGRIFWAGDSVPSLSSELSSAGICIIVFGMLLPLILVLTAGIWQMAGGRHSIGGSIIIFVVLVLYIIMAASIGVLWPEPGLDQEYSRGFACPLHLVCSGCASATAVISLICLPRKKAVKREAVYEEKIQQPPNRYQILSGTSGQSQGQQAVMEASGPGPRGVMVGLSGIYSGAEIPLTDGEYIKLGRVTDNDLVFSGQKRVSRNHCQIMWSAAKKMYTVFDFSTNGIFLDDSETRLTKNVALDIKPGSVLAIGDRTNTFRLD